MPLEMVRNDITKMPIDAIVNAAKESLMDGGSMDGCIHRAAGPELLAECRTLGGCKTGDAKVRKAYHLPYKYVIHTVGPVWQGGSYGEREKLVSCYRTSLAIAKEHGCETVAVPLISSGFFGYPKDQAIRVAVDTIGEFLMENGMTVCIVIFDRAAYQISGKLFSDIAQYIDDHYVDEHTDSQRERLYRLRHLEIEESLACEKSAAPCAPMAVGAVSGAIHHISNIHKYARKKDVPEKTMFIITTDGYENASKRYNYEKVRKMIERQKEKYGWEFLFLGTNIDAAAEAKRFGISADRAVNYKCDKEGTALNYEVISEAVCSVRAARPLGADWKSALTTMSRNAENDAGYKQYSGVRSTNSYLKDG